MPVLMMFIFSACQTVLPLLWTIATWKTLSSSGSQGRLCWSGVASFHFSICIPPRSSIDTIAFLQFLSFPHIYTINLGKFCRSELIFSESHAFTHCFHIVWASSFSWIIVQVSAPPPSVSSSVFVE